MMHIQNFVLVFLRKDPGHGKFVAGEGCHCQDCCFILGGGAGAEEGGGLDFRINFIDQNSPKTMTYQILCEPFSERILGVANLSLEKGAIAEIVVIFWEAGEGDKKGKG